VETLFQNHNSYRFENVQLVVGGPLLQLKVKARFP
jgi:hypothetical protein